MEIREIKNDLELYCPICNYTRLWKFDFIVSMEKLIIEKKNNEISNN